jgi:hypothetical protein
VSWAAAKTTPRATRKGKKTSAAQTKTERSGGVTIDVDEVTAAVSSLTPPTEVQKRAWRLQFPAADVLTLAMQTRAHAVVAEAWGWL